MKDNRRSFLKKAVIGSAAISSGLGLTALKANNPGEESAVPAKTGLAATDAEQVFPGWKISYDEATSILQLNNGPVSLQGLIKLLSGNQNTGPRSGIRSGVIREAAHRVFSYSMKTTGTCSCVIITAPHWVIRSILNSQEK